MNDLKFLPFYEWIANRIPGYIVGRVIVSGLLGSVFLIVHCLSIGSQVCDGGCFGDWSWFLAVLISTAMLCLYYATHTLRAMFPEMDIRLPRNDSEVYMRPLTDTLSDSKFI